MLQVIGKPVLGKLALDGVPWPAGAYSVRTSALDHKTAYYPVKDQPVIESFLDQTDKITDRIRSDLRIQLRLHHISIFHGDGYNWICHTHKFLSCW
jgi:hypothetical protein